MSETQSFHKFRGTDGYIAAEALQMAVNAALTLERPLLIKGEPGTGKTALAEHIAAALGRPLIKWNVKSTSKANQGLYTYDVVQRLNDSRFGGDGKDISDLRQYIRMGPLGRAFRAEEPVVLLIDEIDKADVEFPNDLLQELDEMAFDIAETQEHVAALHRPFVLITSNAEKELPQAFLRRCVFHYIAFPEPMLMGKIVRVHFPALEATLLEVTLRKFYWLRQVDQLRKKPSTSELIDWLRVLIHAGVSLESIETGLPFLGALIKQEQDTELLRRHGGSRR